MEGLLDRGIDYWPEGEWDIVPAGIICDEVVEFDRHDFPDLIPDGFWQARLVWLRYRDGHLMYSGGVMDQPISHQIIIGIYQTVYQKWVEYKRKK